MHRPKQAINDRFIRISTNVIYCITCTLCKKIYLGETGRNLSDRFRKDLRDVGKKRLRCSKTVARNFNLPNHSTHNITICLLSLHQGNTESRKIPQQKFIFQLGILKLHGINERSVAQLIYSYVHITTFSPMPGIVPSTPYINTQTAIPLIALTKGQRPKGQFRYLLTVEVGLLSTCLVPNLSASLPHQRGTTVSFETKLSFASNLSSASHSRAG